MTALKLAIAALAAANGRGAAAGEAGGTAERKFSLPDRGAFVVQAPRMAGRGAAAARHAVADDRSCARDSRLRSSSRRSGRRRKTVPATVPRRERRSSAVEGVKSQAVEKELRIVELQGRTGPGFDFTATDRAPRPGEFKFMTQGNVQVGGLSVLFTILTNDGQDAVAKQALDMMRGAAHDAAAR